MEQITEILHNYYLICQWHRLPFDERSLDLSFLHQRNVMENETKEIGKETAKDLTKYMMEDKEGVSGTTLLLVRRQLRVSRRVSCLRIYSCYLCKYAIVIFFIVRSPSSIIMIIVIIVIIVIIILLVIITAYLQLGGLAAFSAFD